MKLPEWSDIERKRSEGVKLNAIEKFILDNEPAGIDHEENFREGLSHAFDLVWKLATDNTFSEQK
jgi:hypothetical protein